MFNTIIIANEPKLLPQDNNESPLEQSATARASPAYPLTAAHRKKNIQTKKNERIVNFFVIPQQMRRGQRSNFFSVQLLTRFSFLGIQMPHSEAKRIKNHLTRSNCVCLVLFGVCVIPAAALLFIGVCVNIYIKFTLSCFLWEIMQVMSATRQPCNSIGGVMKCVSIHSQVLNTQAFHAHPITI